MCSTARIQQQYFQLNVFFRRRWCEVFFREGWGRKVVKWNERCESIQEPPNICLNLVVTQVINEGMLGLVQQVSFIKL